MVPRLQYKHDFPRVDGPKAYLLDMSHTPLWLQAAGDVEINSGGPGAPPCPFLSYVVVLPSKFLPLLPRAVSLSKFLS